MQPLFFVGSTETPDGERFFVVQPEHVPNPVRLTLEERKTAWLRFVERSPLLTEEDVRRHLADTGLSADEVETQVQRARRVRATAEKWHASGEQFVWEQTTAVGYRNAGGQVVLRGTGLLGTLPFQRLYVLRCDHCGHEYGANGCDVHNRRCHYCQDGPPDLTATDILE